MRASGASELRIFLYYYLLKLLFLSLFCWYIRDFVSALAYWGGGGGGGLGALAPPPKLN